MKFDSFLQHNVVLFLYNQLSKILILGKFNAQRSSENHILNGNTVKNDSKKDVCNNSKLPRTENQFSTNSLSFDKSNEETTNIFQLVRYLI